MILSVRIYNYLFLVLACLLLAPCGHAQTIFVDGTNGNDAYDGSSATIGANPIGPKRSIAAGVTAVATNGVVRVAAGTYTIGASVNLNKALTLIGQDTLTSTNTAGRVVVTSSGDLNLLQVSASSVTIKGLDLRVKSSGNTSISAGSNTEESAIVLSGFPGNTKIICCRIVSANGAPSFFSQPNGTGIRALTGSNSITIRDCVIGSADTVNPASAGVLTRCIWQENGEGIIKSNRIFNGSFQDVVIRFSNQTAFTFTGNVTTGSGIEINSNNNTVTISANTFNSPAVTDPPNGALVIKGSILKPLFIDKNLFNRYAAPALQLYGVPTASITRNDFYPKQSGTYTHVRATTCNNPTGCTLNANSTLTFLGNRFQAGAAGQGIAVQMIRQTTNNVITLPSFSSAASPNTFSSAINKAIILDGTAGLEVGTNIDARESRFYFGVDTVKAVDLSPTQMVSVEKQVDHFMDNIANGFVTIQTSTAVTSASGTNTILQRAIDKAGSGGKAIADGPFTYGTLSVSNDGTLLTTDTIIVSSWTNNAPSPYTLLGQVNISGTLSLAGSYLVALPPSSIFLASSTPAALTLTGTPVIDGKFGRNVAAGNTYIWPIGVGSQSRYATINLTSVSGLGRIYGQATTTDPTTLPPGTFPLATANQVAFNALLPSQGTWFFSTPVGTADYTLNLRVRGLPVADAYATVQHTGNTPFVFTGTPVTAGASGQWVFTSDSTVQSSGLSTFSEFAIASGQTITPVPLRILSFTSTRIGIGQAKLKWTLRDGFEAKSLRVLLYDGFVWIQLRSILAANNQANYTVTLPIPYTACTLQLQALEANGQVLDQALVLMAEDIPTHKPTITSGPSLIRVHPNDFVGELYISNSSGQAIYSMSLFDQKELLIPTQPGIYVARFRDTSHTRVYKVAVW